MQLVLIRQWQTAALLLLVVALALGPVAFPGVMLPTLPLECLGLLASLTAGAAAVRLGRHRQAAAFGAIGACLSALLFWWMLALAVSGILTAGLTVSTVAAGLLAACFVGSAATFSGASGSLWRLADSSGRRARIGRGTDPRTITTGLRG